MVFGIEILVSLRIFLEFGNPRVSTRLGSKNDRAAGSLQVPPLSELL